MCKCTWRHTQNLMFCDIRKGGGGGTRANSTRDYDGNGWVPDEFIGLYLWFHKCICDCDAFLISQIHFWFWGECPHKCICAPKYLCDLGVSALHLWFKYKTNGRLSIWYDIKMSKVLIIQALKTFGCNTLQHTATHCNTLQHTATHCITLILLRVTHIDFQVKLHWYRCSHHRGPSDIWHSISVLLVIWPYVYI